MNKYLVESLNKLMTAHCSEDNASHDQRYYTKKNIDELFKTYKPTWDNIVNKPTTYTPANHNHDDIYYRNDTGGVRLEMGFGSIKLYRPITEGGHARGIVFTHPETKQDAGGFGFFGIGNTYQRAYIAVNTQYPWSTGLFVCENFLQFNKATFLTNTDGIQLYTKNGVVTVSDERAKDNIQKLDDAVVKQFVMNLNPISYTMKNGNSGRTHYGLSAQEVERTMTDIGLSTMDFAGIIKTPNEENDNYDYGLRNDEFIPMLIKMIQIQQIEINKLKEVLKYTKGDEST